jgi:hypothetical protein
MKVKLIYKTLNAQYFGTSNTITIARAKELTKELIENNKEIIEIYLKVFDGYFWKRYKTLYKKENE